MSLNIWCLFFVAYLFITLAPGPNVLFVVQNAVKYGYKEAFISIAGNLSCQAFIILLVAAGAGALLERSPQAFFVLKIVGGTYLIYLGVKGLVNSKKDNSKSSNVGSKKGSKKNNEADLTSPEQKESKFSNYRTGFLVSASNPKTVIFLSAFLPQFISSESAVHYQFFVMFLTICIVVSAVHIAYSCIARNIKRSLDNSMVSRHFSKIYNSAFIAFGGSLIFSNR